MLQCGRHAVGPRRGGAAEQLGQLAAVVVQRVLCGAAVKAGQGLSQRRGKSSLDERGSEVGFR